MPSASTGQSSRARLVEVPRVIRPGVERREALRPLAGASPSVLVAVGPGRVPAHTNEERPIVPVVRRPPGLRRRHHFEDVLFERRQVERLERLHGLREPGVRRARARRGADGAPGDRAGSATSPGWCVDDESWAGGRGSRGFRIRWCSWSWRLVLRPWVSPSRGQVYIKPWDRKGGLGARPGICLRLPPSEQQQPPRSTSPVMTQLPRNP